MTEVVGLVSRTLDAEGAKFEGGAVSASTIIDWLTLHGYTVTWDDATEDSREVLRVLKHNGETAMVPEDYWVVLTKESTLVFYTEETFQRSFLVME